MIGNDIVDLKLAAIESNWQRKGFLDKLFSKKEQGYINTSTSSFQMVWRLWSMKESAYKINVQQEQQRFFNPKKLKCILINSKEGLVTYNKRKYITASEVTEDYIYTVATLKTMNNVLNNCFKIKNLKYNTQHSDCYARLKKEVYQKNNLQENTLSIKKNPLGIPKLHYQGKPLQVFFSITHHGHFGAYSLINN